MEMKNLDVNIDIARIHHDRFTKPVQMIMIRGAMRANTGSPMLPSQVLVGRGRTDSTDAPNKRYGRALLKVDSD